ncbi:MAG: hypothetical protein R6U55_01510 [Desulfovermiculus sp.]
MLTRSYIFISLVFILGLTSCQAWEKTKTIYRGAVFPAHIDVGAEPDVGEDVQRLAHVVTPVDLKLEELARSMQRVEETSMQEAQALSSRFSWLNGVAALSPSGEILHQVPSQPIKEITFQEILDKRPSQEAGLYLEVLDQDLGPELCVVKSLHNGNQVTGHVVAHFDPRTLFKQGPGSQTLLVLAQGDVLWSGVESAKEEKIQEKDWSKMLESKVQGDFDLENEKFVWLSRYVGESPLVYVTHVEKND